MKKLFILVSMFALAVMTGCDATADDVRDDNTEDVVGNGGTDTAYFRCVSRVNARGTDESGEAYNSSYSLKYNDDKHLAECFFTGDEASGLNTGFIKFVRSGSTLEFYSVEGENNDAEGELYGVLTLNDDGYAVGCVYYLSPGEQRIVLSYDSDGYLVKAEETFTEEGYSGPEKRVYTYTWKDGNLASIQLDEGDDYHVTVSLTYGTVPYVPVSVKMAELPYAVFGELSIFSEFWGKPSKCLPESMSYNGREPLTMNYTLNPDGTVSTMNYSEGGSGNVTIEFAY